MGLMAKDELDALVSRVADHLARPETMTISFAMIQVVWPSAGMTRREPGSSSGQWKPEPAGRNVEQTTAIDPIRNSQSRCSNHQSSPMRDHLIVWSSSSAAEPPGCVPVIAASVEIRCH